MPEEVLARLETRRATRESLLDMNDAEAGSLVSQPRLGSAVRAAARRLPAMHVELVARPITRTVLRVELTLTADFDWAERSHGAVQPWCARVHVALPARVDVTFTLAHPLVQQLALTPRRRSRAPCDTGLRHSTGTLGCDTGLRHSSGSLGCDTGLRHSNGTLGCDTGLRTSVQVRVGGGF